MVCAVKQIVAALTRTSCHSQCLSIMPAYYPQDDDDSFREASADQRAMVRLVRATREEISKRLIDIGCMKTEEIKDTLESLDQLIDLHVYAHSLDDRVSKCG